MLQALLKKYLLQTLCQFPQQTDIGNITDQNEIETLLFFTCDLEFSPDARSGNFQRDQKLAIGIRKLADLLDKNDVRAIFFAEGKVCINYADMVGKLHNIGHEIGSHGFSHKNFASFWPTNLRFSQNIFSSNRRIDDIRKSKQAIYAITKENPICFRAPHLAIDERTLQILETEGFLLDSSLYNPAFGKLSCPYYPSRNDLTIEGDMKILEVPITVSVIPNRKFFYWRYPSILTLEEKEIKKTVQLMQSLYFNMGYQFALFVTLIHPYELCSPAMVSRVSTFLTIMKKIEAKSVSAAQLIKSLSEH